MYRKGYEVTADERSCPKGGRKVDAGYREKLCKWLAYRYLADVSIAREMGA